MKDIYVIIPAAGRGERMGKGSNKLFIDLLGMPVLGRTLSAFSALGDEFDIHCVVVTNEENLKAVEDLVSSMSFGFVEKVMLGGSSRTISVSKGVSALASLQRPPLPADPVLIHDGGRCLISRDVIMRCIGSLDDHEVSVAAVPAKNTIKVVRSDDRSIVDRTPDRSMLVEVQTPQSFRYSALLTAYGPVMDAGDDFDDKVNGHPVTDDVSLAEALGYDIFITEGSYSNIKITTAEDIAVAKGLLSL